MLEKIYKKSVNYLYNKLSQNNLLNNNEKAKLKYSLEVIVGELSKIIIMLCVFSVLGLLKHYIYSLITISLIRPNVGGIHFKTYTQCLVFSIIFIGTCIFLSTVLLVNLGIGILLFIIALVATYLIAPIVSQKRPKYSLEKKKRYRLFSILVILFHFMLFLILKNNPYIQNSIWIISLMIVQLIISWGGEKNAKKKFA